MSVRTTVLLVLASILAADCRAQNQSELSPASHALVKKIRKEQIPTSELFVGLGGEAVKTVTMGDKLERRIEMSFDQLSEVRWRVEVASNQPGTDRPVRLVTAQDNNFAFNSFNTDDEGHYFHKLGYDKATQTELRNSWRGNFPFPDSATRIKGLPLGMLMSVTGTTIEKLTDMEPQLGRRVQRAQVRIPAGKTGQAFMDGEIDWFPDDGYLLCRVDLQLAGRSIVDEAIQYKVHDGRLVPCAVTREFDNGRVQHIEVTELRAANHDKSFYSAEALGLDTPKKPRPRYSKWLMISCVCLVVGLVIFANRHSQ